METSKHILEKEIEILIEDIIKVYEDSGKRTTGEFIEGLSYITKDNKVELWGYSYLAGRPKGKMPPVKEIETWINNKGITSLDLDSSGLAWAIAKKIAKEGTDDESHLAIYEEVLTPKRMDSIIKKVSEFHTQNFIEEVTVRIAAISQKYIN